jgi:phytoene synthase
MRKEPHVSLSQSRRLITRAFAEREVPAGDAAALLAQVRVRAGHDLQREYHPPRSDEPAVALDQAYLQCRALTRQHSRSFYVSSGLLPREKRRAIRALYAFCRTSDDLVDRAAGDPVDALAHWVALVHADRPPAHDPVLVAWHDTVQRHGIARELVDELLAGIAMDLTVDRYETFDRLWLYCYRVASVVGLLSMQIIGYYEGATEYAVKLGVALQLTNILRDVGEDAGRGRVYLPLEDLAQFGLSDRDVLDGVRNQRFRALMQFEIARAHRLYDESRPGIALLDPDGRLAIAAASDIYRGILGRIEANGYDVFGRRAYVPLHQKLWIVARLWPQYQRRVRP